MNAAEIILLVVGSYAFLGAAFATAFVVRGVAQVDHAAAQGPWTFRMLIWPGSAALWPVMMMKWIRAARTARSSGARLTHAEEER